MIAQWKNECISLSVLPVAWVMIAHWENECISLSVLFKARVMIAQWENECISLSVPSPARVMITQWENECISLSVLPVAWVQFPAIAENLERLFPGWSHTLGDGDGHPLKGYEEYEAIQLLPPSGPPGDQNGHGSLKRRTGLAVSINFTPCPKTHTMKSHFNVKDIPYLCPWWPSQLSYWVHTVCTLDETYQPSIPSRKINATDVGNHHWVYK